jgi:hypothetical protein
MIDATTSTEPQIVDNQRSKALSWSEEKHRATDNAVRAVQSLDGASQAVENVSGRRRKSGDPQT